MSQIMDEVTRQIVREFKKLPELKPLWTKQRRFLLAFAKTCQVQSAAKLSGVYWVNHYKWLRGSNGENYKVAFDFAKELAADYAEGDVYQRAFLGEDRTVTKSKRNEVITEQYKDKSDILAIFMLKGLRPQYRDNFAINNFAGPVQINAKLDNQVVHPLRQVESSTPQTSLPESEKE